MNDDISINKASIIRRCLALIVDEYQDYLHRLDNFTIQDAVVLNLLRACEAAIDLAMHHVAENQLGIPHSSRDAFTLLQNANPLRATTANAMRKMVGSPHSSSSQLRILG